MAEVNKVVNDDRESTFRASRRSTDRPFAFKSVRDMFRPSRRRSQLEEVDDEMRESLLRDAMAGVMQQNEVEFATRTGEEVLKAMQSDVQTGLTSHQVEKRLMNFGHNALAKPPPPSWCELFLEQFYDQLVIMLLVAALVSAILGQYAAFGAILLIVIANALMGVYQEMNAANALAALTAGDGVTVEVTRDEGKRSRVAVEDLVPGDIVHLKLGEQIPADMRVLRAADLTVKEMNLTGESRPVKKNARVVERNAAEPAAAASDDAKETIGDGEAKDGGDGSGEEKKKEKALDLPNFLYSSCDMLTGNVTAVVVKTGKNTYVGRIAEMIRKAKADKEEGSASPLREKLNVLGKKLGYASLLISLVVFLVGVCTISGGTCRGCDPGSDQHPVLQMVLVAVSLTVAAVPESLPACVTLTLSFGMQHMAAKNAVVRRLLSVETLGSADVICTDKTGTLTAGHMTAIKFNTGFQAYEISGKGHEIKGVVYKEGEDKSKAPEVKKGSRIEQVWASYAMVCNATLEFKKGVDTEGKETGEGRWVPDGDPTESALIIAARKLNIERKNFNQVFERKKENPFNSNRKMMSVLVERKPDAKLDNWYEGKRFVGLVKGGSDQVLKKCTRVIDEDGKVAPMTDELRARVQGGIDGFASQALRVLAVAYKTYDTAPEDDSDAALESDLTLLGFAGLMDPVRDGVKDAITTATGAGIRTVMITGDYAKTAKAIAENIGIVGDAVDTKSAVIACDVIVRPKSQRILEIEKFMDEYEKKVKAKEQVDVDGFNAQKAELEELEEQMDNITSRARVFARAKPEDKLIIIKSFQRQNHVCAMTGDGVNDGPALQRADIGVAMGNGTDVAKGASDMVLKDSNYCTIVEAVQEGRVIYNNICKFVYFLLSTNVAEVMTILFASIIGLPSPLLPTQILWLNLTTDGFPAVALATEKGEPNIMNEGPRSRQEPVIEKLMIVGIGIQTLVLTGTCLTTYIVGLLWNNKRWDGLGIDEGDDRAKGFEVAQTMTILHIVFAELLRAYGARSLRESIFTIGLLSNTAMHKAVGASVGATLFIALVPGVMDVFNLRYISGREWALVVGLAFVPIIVDEITKAVYRYTGFGLRPRVHGPVAFDDKDGLELKEVKITESKRRG